MRKILVIAVGLMMLGNLMAFAANSGSTAGSDLEKTEAKLVGLDASKSRVNRLEKRVDTLERELHDQSDAIRDLERDLSDLRRRR